MSWTSCSSTAFRNAAQLVGQAVQILVALLDALERILRKIVLDKIMLNAGLSGVREDVFPVDHAAADFRHILHLLVRIGRRPFRPLRQFLHVLYMYQRKAVR